MEVNRDPLPFRPLPTPNEERELKDEAKRFAASPVVPLIAMVFFILLLVGAFLALRQLPNWVDTIAAGVQDLGRG